MLSTFSYPYWPFLCLLWKRRTHVFCPFFKWIICLFISISSLEKCLFSFSFLRCLFFFSLLSNMSSLDILDIKSLSDMLFANIFFHSVGCLFVLLIFLYCTEASLWWCVLLVYFFCCYLCFWCHIQKNLCQGQCQRALPLCFLLGVSWFQGLHISL